MDAKKDWGYARDYVEGMVKILNYKYADDFVVGTGRIHSVREFVSEAFARIGVNVNWKGKGLNEVGLSDRDELLVRVSKEFFRPLEADNFAADYSKARRLLNWSPKVGFEELVAIMVDNEISRVGKISSGSRKTRCQP